MPRVLRVDCYNQEYSLENTKTLTPARFGVQEHTAHKTHKYHWLDERGIVTLGVGPLSGTNITQAQDAVFTIKEPSTNKLIATPLPDFSRALRSAHIDYVLFEKKSPRPLVIGACFNGELHLTFKQFSDAWIEHTQKKDVTNARTRVARFFKPFYKGCNTVQGFTSGSGAKTGYGSVASTQHTKRGGVGSVLKHAHNVFGFFSGGDFVDEIFDELTINRVYQATQGFLAHNYPQLTRGLEPAYAFNNAYQKTPHHLEALCSDISSFGAYTGLCTKEAESRVLARINECALDAVTVQHILGGVMHAYAHNMLSREEFVRADVNMNAEEYAKNPYYYANEHARLYVHVINAIEQQTRHGRILSLPYNHVRKEVARAFGIRVQSYFKNLPSTPFYDIMRAEGGLSAGHNMPANTFSELVGMKVFRKIDFVEHAVKTRELFSAYNQKSV